ncbi:MAG: hypothetical protein M9925_09930 [Chloroflexi bacterium]|nr:hypothetical protein [Chloroflexota bacterium]
MELYNLEEWARARQNEALLAFRRAQLLGLTTGPVRARRRGLTRFGAFRSTETTAGSPAIPREAS